VGCIECMLQQQSNHVTARYIQPSRSKRCHTALDTIDEPLGKSERELSCGLFVCHAVSTKVSCVTQRHPCTESARNGCGRHSRFRGRQVAVRHGARKFTPQNAFGAAANGNTPADDRRGPESGSATAVERWSHGSVHKPDGKVLRLTLLWPRPLEQRRSLGKLERLFVAAGHADPCALG
jgi:hypothetical protein